MLRFSLALLAFLLLALPVGAHAQPSPVDDGFVIMSDQGGLELQVGHYAQLRFVFDRQETNDRDQPFNQSAFELSRARLVFQGHVFEPERLRFFLNLGFDRGVFSLRDLALDLRPVPDALEINLGLLKRPFSRQFMVPASRLEFLERAITDQVFGSGRDIGVLVHNGFWRSPMLEWAVGANNGKADEVRRLGETPEHFAPEVVVRLGYNHGETRGYVEEADRQRGPLRFALGASAFARFDQDNDERSEVQMQVDGLLKLRGLSATAAFYASWTQQGASFTDQEASAKGFHLQLGYMLSDSLQPALRYAIVSPEGPNNDIQEFGMAVSAFLMEGDRLLWQTDFLAINTDDVLGGRTRFLGRTQLQWQW